MVDKLKLITALADKPNLILQLSKTEARVIRRIIKQGYATLQQMQTIEFNSTYTGIIQNCKIMEDTWRMQPQLR